MPGATTLYFPELGPAWVDWVQVVNVGNEPTKILAIARNPASGQPTWSEEKEVDAFECWTPNVEAIGENSSMQLTADQPIVAERHMHGGSNVMDFVGAAVEYETVGLRLFFPELVSGARDWFRFLNVGEAEALVNMVIRNRNGDVIRQHHRQIPPLCTWDLAEEAMGNVVGTVEVQSTQLIVGERHLHYQGGQTSVGQFGQVISDGPTTLYFPEVGPAWNDWAIVVNVGQEEAKVTLIAREDGTGNPVWSDDKALSCFECWTPDMDAIKIKSSLEVRSDESIAAERHMHSGTSIVDLPGASAEGGHVGRHLFFPEIHTGSHDWFRFLNVDEADAMVNIVIRDRHANILRQLHNTIKPFCCWDVDENAMGDVIGTVEVQSTQSIVGERHLHYQDIHRGAVVAQYGVVIGE